MEHQKKFRRQGPIRVRSFPPIIDERSRLLVLGSMPGVASLKAHQYYGNERNYMWRILFAVFEGREPDPAYEDRLAFALRHGVALWDTIAACDRPGSLDSDIKDVEPNDIPGLLEDYPNVDTIVCGAWLPRAPRAPRARRTRFPTAPRRGTSR